MSLIDDDEEDEKPKNPIYSFIKYSILTVCVLVTAYRIYLNYRTYCEYKVLINSKVELNEKEILPQLSICFYEIIDDNKLHEMNAALANEYHSLIDDPSRYLEWKMNTFTLKELFDLSFNYEDYFINCTYLDQNAINEMNCSNSFTITLSAKKKCFNFFHRPISENEDEDKWTYNRILLQNRPWVRIFVKKDNIKHKKRMDIIINPYFTLPNTDKSNPGFKSYTTDYTQSIFMSYDCRKSKRLPAPYETHCLNYTDFGYVDRQHCIYECKAKEFLLNSGGWTEDMTVNRSFAEQIDKLNITLNYTTDLINDCEKNEKKCKHLDCLSKEYTFINKYHKLDVDTISNEIEVRLYLNSAPMSSLEYEELYPLGTSFVQMFIGPASLWLGLSIYSLTKLIFWFLCEITNRKSKRNYRPNNELDQSIDNNKMDEHRASLLSNPLKLNSALNGYQSNYRSFLFDNNLAKNLQNSNPYKLDAYSTSRPIDKLAYSRSIDNYYHQLNKTSNSRFNDRTSTNENYSINSISGKLSLPHSEFFSKDIANADSFVSPFVYKTGLEMYPKKALKMRKINEEDDFAIGDHKAYGKADEKNIYKDKINGTMSVLKEDLTMENLNQRTNNESWISKVVKQKDKLVNYLFKSNHKVYPNLIN